MSAFKTSGCLGSRYHKVSKGLLNGPLTSSLAFFSRSANLISPDASRFRARRAQVERKVQDFGEGIPEEKLEHVFDRFYRDNDSITMAGFGLGLSIAKSLMDTMNGSISLSSAHDEETIVRLIFPASMDS